MLLLFIGMQLLQAIHAFEDHSFSSFDTGSGHSKHQVFKQQEKCFVCDYNQHRSQEFMWDFEPVNFNCSILGYRMLRVGYSQSIYQTAVHAWTNKGPPVKF
ncbi:hypothetical protein [Desertivirga xinjiangensis]|uniref:hypothetical protein n=1 Tax=Desertivirga xinjiangensis TaxID=539206 RepID=UPI002108EB4A|nr:hypothetical protein [Pedobacter xinjiangensis]